MGQPSLEWIAEKREAERRQVLDFQQLDSLVQRLDGYVRRAETAAAALAVMPNSNPAARTQEAEDLRRAIEFVAHYQANIDRVYLLEEPSRRSTSRVGQVGGAPMPKVRS